MFRALSRDTYSRGDADYTVTQSNKSVRQVQLKERHGDTVVLDASELVYSLLGSSVHSVLELAGTDNDLVEQRFTSTIQGEGWTRTLSGMTDLLELKTGVLSDFKVTSVYSFLLGAKEDWTRQLNLNAMLMRDKGFVVNKVQIVAILRDWSKGKSLTEANYPKCAIHVTDVPLWDHESQKKFARERIALHVAAEKQADADLPICSPEERWYRGEAFAVYKDGNKKATRVLDTEGEATSIAAQLANENVKATYSVSKREGKSVMCLDYCEVAHACAYGRKLREEAGIYVLPAPTPVSPKPVQKKTISKKSK